MLPFIPFSTKSGCSCQGVLSFFSRDWLSEREDFRRVLFDGSLLN